MPSSWAIAMATPPFADPSSFVSAMALYARGLREEPCLLEPVLPRRRVDDEQRLVRSPLEPSGDHASHLGELVHEIPLRVQAAGGVDDDDVSLTRTARLHGVVGDGGGIRAARPADELGARPLRPDLELLLGRRAEGVGGADEHRAAVLGQLASELSDRRRLARAVDADDEDDGRAFDSVPEHRRVAEERLDLLGERLTEIAQLAAGLEAPHELRRRGNADVGADQRHLEPLPRVLLCGVERGSELRDECPSALAQRVAKPREEATPLLGLSRPVLGVPEQLGPRPRHGGRLAPVRRSRRRAARAGGGERRSARRRRCPS